MKAQTILAVPLFLFAAAGSSALAANPTQVTTSSYHDRHPSWTADGQHIVFESNRSGRYQLYKIPAAGGIATQLTFGYGDIHPEVSPDGTTVAFVRTTALGTGAVWIVPISGGEPHQITPDNSDDHDWEPSWSPDGQTIHFSRRASGNWGVYRVPVSGGPGTAVYTQGNASVSKVSPDGQQLTYALVINGAYNAVEAPISDPTSFAQLTFETSNTAGQDYSPDGTKIVLTSSKDGWQELWELDRSTLDMTQLTFDGSQTGIQPYNNPAEYSPDGTRIAFGSRRVTGDYNIWVLDLEGEPPVGENILTVADGRGLPGGNRVEIPINLISVQSLRGVEFQLVDHPDWLEVTDIRLTGRASSLEFSFLDNGELHVLIYGADGAVIPPGLGDIARILVAVDSRAPIGETVELSLTQVVLSDVTGESAPVETRDGQFEIARVHGDVTGDNTVDVGDLVRLVEIILGTASPSPSRQDLAAADCNNDESHNILDITCVVDLILGDMSAPNLHELAGSAESDLLVHVTSEVRGLQFSGAVTATGTGELDPFSMYSGTSGANRSLVMAFDPRGQGWEVGDRTPFRVTGQIDQIKAYGPGGKPLTASITGTEIWIGLPPEPGLRVLPNLPNPFRGSTVIHFATESAGLVLFTVYDIRGARVSIFEESVSTSGEHAIPWDAVDAYGRPLPAGVYIAMLELGGNRAVTRLTHLGRPIR